MSQLAPMGKRSRKTPKKELRRPPRTSPVLTRKRNLLARWYSRHQNPTNFWLHMVGIPACFIAAPVMLILQQWLSAGALFVGGYALQFLGHAVEGNKSGEAMLVRRLMGRR